MLQALLPGLKRLAGRLLLEAASATSSGRSLLAHCWERIRSYPLERRPRRIAANLLLDTRTPTLAELRGSARLASAAATDAAAADAAAASGRSEVEVVLARAVRAGALSREEAVLILRTRIDGVALASIAAEP